MKLTTRFSIYSDSSEEDKSMQVEGLVKTIRTFAAMGNCAFWDAKSSGDVHCVAVRAYLGEMEDAAYIKSDEIEKEVYAWCDDLKDWCNDVPDTDLDDERFAHKTLRVEITDCENNGGFHVATYDADGDLENELWILPLRNKEGAKP